MTFSRRTFAICLAVCVVSTASCADSESADVSVSGNSVVTTESMPTEDTVVTAIDEKSDCATALAAFSAVSNILMSGLAKPQSFETDRYEANLGLTRVAITTEIEKEYSAFLAGYGAAGEALTSARTIGAATTKGIEAVDQATAILNDAAVIQAAQLVAAFLVNDCTVTTAQ
jgi:hypothetical protein